MHTVLFGRGHSQKQTMKVVCLLLVTLIYRKVVDLDDSGLKDPRSHAHAQISALYNLGCLLAEEGDHVSAVSTYQEAIRRPLDQYKPHSLYNMLGQSLFQINRLTEAEKWFKASLSVKPDHVPTHLTYARLLAHVGKIDESEELYERALSLEPENTEIYKHYSNFYMSRGQMGKGARIMEDAANTNLGSADSDIVFSTASAYRQAGMYEKAEEYYTKVVKITPELASAHMNLGAILHVRRKYKLARESYNKALKLKPNDQLIRQNLEKLERTLAEKSLK